MANDPLSEEELAAAGGARRRRGFVISLLIVFVVCTVATVALTSHCVRIGFGECFEGTNGSFSEMIMWLGGFALISLFTAVRAIRGTDSD